MIAKLGVRLAVLVLLLVPQMVVFAEPDTRDERAEVRFLEGMIDHHQMALDMAIDCLDKASTEAVVAICQAVIDAQTPEIAQMQAWLSDWYNIRYVPLSMLEMSEMMDMMDMMGDSDEHGEHGAQPTDPPMTMGMMAGFDRLEGVAYDIAWLEAMVDHHDLAIHMAERILPRAVHPELAALAQNIIDAQSQEIEQMEALLVTLE